MKPRQITSHAVAELVHAALAAQQHEAKGTEKAQRPRRKRAPRRRQRAEEQLEGDVMVSDDASQSAIPVNGTAGGGEVEHKLEAPAPTTVSGRRKRRSKCKNAVLREREKVKTRSQQMAELTPPASCAFVVRNLVTPDEVEDLDEIQELEDDTRAEFAKFGALTQLRICGLNDEQEPEPMHIPGDVVVEFEDPQAAVTAFSAYASRVFGGRTVSCIWLSADAGEAEQVATSATVRVTNMLAPDELEDDDEFDDIQDEMAGLFERFSAVRAFEICRASGDITVEFDEVESARHATAKMHGSIYGGRSVTASLVEAYTAQPAQASDEDAMVATRDSDRVMPMTPIKSELVDVVVQFLKRLASFQERAHHQNPLQSKRSRRFVLGLHEVRRGLAVRKIRLVLVANDIEECGILDEKLAEILEIAKRDDVPVISPMNRRKLGRVLSKNARVSCVGIYSIDGANDLFAQIVRDIKSHHTSVK